jgi:hypothetical protein
MKNPDAKACAGDSSHSGEPPGPNSWTVQEDDLEGYVVELTRSRDYRVGLSDSFAIQPKTGSQPGTSTAPYKQVMVRGATCFALGCFFG